MRGTWHATRRMVWGSVAKGITRKLETVCCLFLFLLSTKILNMCFLGNCMPCMLRIWCCAVSVRADYVLRV
jgi:hypothetical protein